MRSGGLIAVAAPSRHDSPELAHALPKTSLTFDAELAPGLLREQFEELEVQRWDPPLILSASHLGHGETYTAYTGVLFTPGSSEASSSRSIS